MKISTILAAVFVTVATAKSCNRGGVYCGSSLLRKGKARSLLCRTALALKNFTSADKRRFLPPGNYREHIKETLKSAGVSQDERHIQNSKFDCLSGGDIKYREFCASGCGGTDSKDPDYCL
ncbi:DNA-binding protein hgh1 protein [Purpureocillium lavendulum]|uniref:DNA-binding protein hgh1 protein n=1 Tax=Purpureocillium lavendulum TaxID=1247861 RepID=A0AB34G9E2_9HYPO|nr:DNA-binding protein hgh1 protein [Purpureocillium lavendulum]